MDTTLYVNTAGDFMLDGWNTDSPISKNLSLWYETHTMWVDPLDWYLGSLTINSKAYRGQKGNYDHWAHMLCTSYQHIVLTPNLLFLKLPWLTGLVLIHISLLLCHLHPAALCRTLSGRHSPTQLFRDIPEGGFLVSLAGNPTNDFLFPALFLVFHWTSLPYNMP